MFDELVSTWGLERPIGSDQTTFLMQFRPPYSSTRENTRMTGINSSTLLDGLTGKGMDAD